MKTANVEEEYKKNDQLKADDVKSLKEWMEKQPHLPKITDLEIILFLNCTFYSLERAKTVIDTYYSCRTYCPEFFDARDPNGAIVKELDVVLFYHLPETTLQNHEVVYTCLKDKDPANFRFTEILKIFSMYVDVRLLQKGTAPGHQIILDLDNLVFGHLSKLSIMAIKKFMYYLQEALPVRLTGVHVINVVPFIDKLMFLVKPFMKKELLDVLIFHTDGLESLYKYVPKKSLPKHLGGEAATVPEMEDLMKKELQNNREYFMEEQKNRVDEAKRPGKAKNAGDLFGTEGSFKKLDID
ncbi:uncharacterized protein CBL_13019 [Carabus blaptoides fortunei]